MFESKIKISCKNPDLVKKSLEPEIENSQDVKTDIKEGKNFVEISIKATKLSHLKAIINSYLGYIQMLNEVEEKEVK